MAVVPKKLLSTLTGIGKAASPVLSGDVTLSQGTGVTLTQVGQNIEVASSGGSGQSPYDKWIHPTAAGADHTTLSAALAIDKNPKSIIMSAVSAESVVASLTLDYPNVSITGLNHPELSLGSLTINTFNITKDTTREESVGTVAVTAGSGVVTGTGTTFTNLNVGDYIYIGYNPLTSVISGKQGYGRWYEIGVITNNTSLTIKPAGSIFRFEFSISGMNYLAGTPTKDILIENMLFDGTSNSGFNGISITNCFNVIIRNCIFRGHIDTAIKLTNCQDIRVQNCTIEGTGRTGIWVINSDDILIESNTVDGANASSSSTIAGGIEINESHRVSVHRNTVVNIRKPGILIEGGWHNEAMNNKVWNCGDGVDAFRCGILGSGGSAGLYRVNQLRVIGNDVRTIRGSGIFINGNSVDTTVANNTILECDDHGIILGDLADTISVTGNICRGNGSDGIRVATVSVFNRLSTISANVCSSNGGNGIFASLSRSLSLTGNICRNNTGNGINSSSGQRQAITGNVLQFNTAGNLNTTSLILSSVANNIIA